MNVPFTREQMRKLPKGHSVTITQPSRRMISELKRRTRILQRQNDRLYNQFIPAGWSYKHGKEIPERTITHKDRIRKSN